MIGGSLPGGWTLARLEEIAATTPNAIADGPFGSNLKLGDYVDSGVPVLQGKNITNDRLRWFDIRFISKHKADELKRSAVRVGDLLIVKIGSIGYSAIVDSLHGFDFAVIPANLAKVTPDPSLIATEYLHHWMKTPLVKNYLATSASKTAQPALSLSKIRGLPVPLPSLRVQRCIAAILDQAEALRVQRRAALDELENLPKAIFLEMFGDPLKNARNWPLHPIGEIGDVVTGNTPPRADSKNFGNAIEWIKSDNIDPTRDFLTRAAEGLSEQGKSIARCVPEGAILVTCIAGSPDSIGNAAMADREVAFNQQINALVPKRANSMFMLVQLRCAKKLVQRASTGGMKGLVSKSRFEAVQMILPPLAAQLGFAERAHAVSRLKEAQLIALREADALFASLQHRAFSGQL